MLLQFGAKWRAGGIHYGSGGFGEAEELAREREPRGRMVMQFVSRKLSRFSNRQPVNSSDYVSGLGRLRKWGYTRIYTGSGLRRVTPYVQFTLLSFALIYSRVYKWVREGARSQVSVVFESHERPEVEE
jgi:hypothetical protein